MRQIHVNLEAAVAGGRLPDAAELRTRLARAVRAVLDAHDVDAGEVSLTLLDDAAIADLNERFLNHQGPTDVISFDFHEPDEPPLGDIYIGLEEAFRNAEVHGVEPLEELTRLAVHGTLHVLGYDHPTGAGREQSEMWRTQEAILRKLLEA